jgi:hypothetical protein
LFEHGRRSIRGWLCVLQRGAAFMEPSHPGGKVYRSPGGISLPPDAV